MTDNFTSTFSGSLKEIIQSKHFKNRSNVIHTLFKEIISIIENVFSDELSIIKLSYTGDYIAFYRMDGPYAIIALCDAFIVQSKQLIKAEISFGFLYFEIDF